MPPRPQARRPEPENNGVSIILCIIGLNSYWPHLNIMYSTLAFSRIWTFWWWLSVIIWYWCFSLCIFYFGKFVIEFLWKSFIVIFINIFACFHRHLVQMVLRQLNLGHHKHKMNNFYQNYFYGLHFCLCFGC